MTKLSYLDKLLIHSTLNHSFLSGDLIDTELGDKLLERGEEHGEIKNVCTKMHVSLSNRIDNAVEFLGISKRVFMEAAVVEALDRLKSIIEEYGDNRIFTKHEVGE